MKNRFTFVGAAALVAAVALFGAAIGSSAPAVQAGGLPATSTPKPPPTPCGGVVITSIRSLGLTGTCTPVSAVRSATPTTSPTSVATNTPVPVATTAPPTVAAANTAVPATATSPSGGQLGAVSGPDTGTGDGTAAGGVPWIILTGMVLALAGLGSLGCGVRKRG